MSLKKLVIVGGVAGGASAAARARRLNENVEIIIIERGAYVSFANCGLPYHIGGEIKKRAALILQTKESFAARFNIEVRLQNEVLSINKDKKTLQIHDAILNKTYEESYDALVLSPGAAPIKPPLAGFNDVRVLSLREIPDMDKIIAALSEKTQHVTVIGAGFIGLEMVEALKARQLNVALVDREAQVLAPFDAEMTAPLKAALQSKNVDLHLGQSVEAILPNERLTLQFSSGANLVTDLVILCIGVKPETQLAKNAGLLIGKTGGILVNEEQQTSNKHIYAVGDAIEVSHFVHGQKAFIPLAGPANRQGRLAADAILGTPKKYRGSQGTAICKLFEISAAMTGLSEKALKAAQIAYKKIYLHGANHASYYPNATPIDLKILYAPENGAILGAQAVGAKGIDKRIDILATAIFAQLNVYQCAELELCYAPPFGAAKDLLNFAGMLAQNLQEGLLTQIEPEEVNAWQQKGALFIDVRDPLEVAKGGILGAINIPLPTLRTRVDEIPRDKTLVVFCQVGLRAHTACRFLQQKGFSVRHLNGGFRSVEMLTA